MTSYKHHYSSANVRVLKTCRFTAAFRHFPMQDVLLPLANLQTEGTRVSLISFR